MKSCLIVNFHSRHIEDIKSMVSKYFDTIEVVDAFTYTFNTSKDYIILSGGAHIPDLYYEKDFYKNWVEYIKMTSTPILGICFGCELIAVAYDCTLADSGHKQVFMQNICLKGESFCLDVKEAHRFNIDTISEEIEVLSYGENNSVEVIRHKTKNILGVQFHPELNQESEKFFEYVLGEMKTYK